MLGRTRGISPLQLLAAGPRASQFLLRSATRGLRTGERRTQPEIPTRLPTIGTAFGVWADELMLAFMATTRLSASAAEFARTSEEVGTALEALSAAGALADPALLHPPPPAPKSVRSSLAQYRGVRYEHLEFASDYAPAVDLPGTTRWLSAAGNRTVHAYVMRHRTPRHWR